MDAAACWDDLAAVDAAKAYAAIDRLAADPAKALPLLRQKLTPVIVDPKWLAARLAELDHKKFTVREAAMRELEKVADAVESELRRALEKPPPLEVRNRLLQVLKHAEAVQTSVPPTALVQRLRALAVLERIGSEEARALLCDLAAGAADARLTQEAAAALRRLR